MSSQMGGEKYENKNNKYEYKVYKVTQTDSL